MKTIQNKVTALCMQELQGNSYDSEIDLYREMGSMCFPVTVICTLQGTSVTQGNLVIFTGNKFAVHLNAKVCSFKCPSCRKNNRADINL